MASGEIVFLLNSDAELSAPPRVQKLRVFGPSAWGVPKKRQLRSEASGTEPQADLRCGLPVASGGGCGGGSDGLAAEAGHKRLGRAAGAEAGNVLSRPFWLSLGSSCS